jgi:acetyl esterase
MATKEEPMPLDPQAKTFLDQLAALGGPPLEEMSVEDARQALEVLSAMEGIPETKAATEDRSITGPDGGGMRLRIYRPSGEGPFPVVVFFHGGGWTIGSIETHDAVCHLISVNTPTIVVSVDYRLAPEHPFPAAVEDCFAATLWAHHHAAEIGGDPARVAVAGDSAGGNLAAVTAIRARDRGGPPLRFQLLVYPGLDMTRSMPSHEENAEGYLLTREAISWFVGHYLGPDGDLRHPDASPYFVEDLSGLPPALVITAELDPLRDEGMAYAQRLRQAGVEATATCYEGMIHAFFGMNDLFDASRKAVDEAVRSLRGALV